MIWFICTLFELIVLLLLYDGMLVEWNYLETHGSSYTEHVCRFLAPMKLYLLGFRLELLQGQQFEFDWANFVQGPATFLIPESCRILKSSTAERFRTVLWSIFGVNASVKKDSAVQDGKSKSEKSQQQEKDMLKDLGILGGGFGPYCPTLSRLERANLNRREKVKLDIEFQRLRNSGQDWECNIWLCEQWES